jgi:hypothetical protein
MNDDGHRRRTRMVVILKRVGRTAILSAGAEVKTKDGILEVSFVETQRIPGGRLNGVLQISLNGYLFGQC